MRPVADDPGRETLVVWESLPSIWYDRPDADPDVGIHAIAFELMVDTGQGGQQPDRTPT